jgi:hypothetical protein
MALGIAVLTLACTVPSRSPFLLASTGVLTRPSVTVIPRVMLPSLAPPPASSILERPYLASLQVSHFVTLTLTKYVYRVISPMLDAYKRYLAATGAVFDNSTGFPRITPEQYANLQSLYFDIGDRTYEITANAQIWPRTLNTFIGGDKNSIYLVVSDIGPKVSGTVDFIAGLVFLERFYCVFDTTNSRLGLATTEFTNKEIN